MMRTLLPLALIAALAACGAEDEPQAAAPRDPQVAQALNDPLMTDPDLSSRNEAAAALTVESDFSLPVLPATPEEIARARAEAGERAGGADKLVPLGEPTGEVRTAFAAFIPENCRRQMTRSAIWAARLSAAMPIYPRAHTLAASGSDATGCKARDVTFATPVSLTDVAAFYGHVARRSGRAADYRQAGAWVSLAGPNWEVRARTDGDHTLVRLATLGR